MSGCCFFGLSCRGFFLGNRDGVSCNRSFDTSRIQKLRRGTLIVSYEISEAEVFRCFFIYMLYLQDGYLTPLMHASYEGYTEIALVLMDAGADIHARNVTN